MPCEEAVISSLDFEYVRALAKENAAIIIDQDKRYLVESRLSPLAQEQGFRSLQALIHALRAADRQGSLHSRTIDALTTNETLFFRDRHPFDALKDTILPELIQARRSKKRLTIWSAAASTGQEAYSLAMLIKDKFPELESWKVSIIGTDLSDTVLEQARSGCYAQHEVNRGLPAPLLIRYFTQVGEKWVINPALRSMVQFRSLNLIGAWANLPVFDLILIRNVLIYFDVETKRGILHRVAAQLAPDGYMAMGSSETPLLITDVFKPVVVGRTSFYRGAASLS